MKWLILSHVALEKLTLGSPTKHDSDQPTQIRRLVSLKNYKENAFNSFNSEQQGYSVLKGMLNYMFVGRIFHNRLSHDVAKIQNHIK